MPARAEPLDVARAREADVCVVCEPSNGCLVARRQNTQAKKGSAKKQKAPATSAKKGAAAVKGSAKKKNSAAAPQKKPAKPKQTAAAPKPKPAAKKVPLSQIKISISNPVTKKKAAATPKAKTKGLVQ